LTPIDFPEFFECLISLISLKSGHTRSVWRDEDPRTFGRHLTVVRGALVISGGLIEPKVFEV
jgi:hypothetical protein